MLIMKRCCLSLLIKNLNKEILIKCSQSTTPHPRKVPGDQIKLLGNKYHTDDWMNLTPSIIAKIGCNLHLAQHHPLSFVRQRIVNYFYKSYYNRIGNPLFSVFDNLSPVVTTIQNFDSLLVPPNHVSRQKSDCYYVNQDTMLRAHTTAHQVELISMGLDNFLVVGDVYRRDEIDATHYPVFHQLDGVRLCTRQEVFQNVHNSNELHIFEPRGVESPDKQACHTLEAVKIMEHDLKTALSGLAKTLFGPDIKYRWTNQYFPFTHPSWELEVYYNDKWMELLGCGIVRHKILGRAGVSDRIGWAFGLGLERIAMKLYSIPDIRVFWSKDSGFLHQFKTDDCNAAITFKPVSVYPQCVNDMSFWLPMNVPYCPNDFYDLAREIGGDIVEQIELIDEYHSPRNHQISHCYRITYRAMERVVTKEEVNKIHAEIARAAKQKLKVALRA